MKKRNLLTILAVSALFSFNNVNAANTCPDGETLQTNYYMFLSVGPVGGTDANYNGSGYLGEDGLIATNKGTYDAYTGAYKYQNLRGVDIKGEGKVAIGDSSANYNANASSAVKWSVEDYWKKWYQAYKGKDSSTYVYSTGNDHYFMHAQNGMWFKFDSTFSNAEQLNSGDERAANIIESDGYTALVNNGTILPSTEITAPSAKTTSSDTILLWKVTRNTKVEDIPSSATGVKYPSTSTWKFLYSPAAYYVQYCAKSNNNETPSTYTVSYDGNSKDATNVPSPSAKTNVGTAVTITSDTPSRKGYTFLGWARKSDATKADDTYKPGSKNYTGEDGSITLYAIWKNNATGTVDNPKTGVSSHIIAFASVTLIGAAGLLIARKKGLFRQL